MSKWVEAISSPINDATVVSRFFKKVIIPRFGMLRVSISDGGTHFIERKIKSMLTKYGVHHKKGSRCHPQTSGQLKVSNREIKVILEKTIACSRND